jgi:hypothetical protein
MFHKNVIKVVRYIFIQLGFFNNTMSMVSGVSVQVSAFWPLASRCWPVARGLTPKIKPRFVNYLRDGTLEYHGDITGFNGIGNQCSQPP